MRDRNQQSSTFFFLKQWCFLYLFLGERANTIIKEKAVRRLAHVEDSIGCFNSFSHYF
jgi:hypothetical protein